jgi:hypothetical protein
MDSVSAKHGLSATTMVGLLAGLAATLPLAAVAQEGAFEDVEIFVVYSSSDEDAQVFVQGGADDPIVSVKAFGPGNAVKLKLDIRDGDDLGYADFVFESPEPSLEELEVAYPAGEYRFRGVSAEGDILTGEADLSYELLDAPVPIFPVDGDEDIPTNGVNAMWEEIEDAEAIRLEVEDEEEEVALKVDLPGDATSFSLPNGWLQPGTEYVLDIKAIAEDGNQTVTDLRFTTAE